MMNNQYAKAYTEILEILKYLPKEEYAKIPQSKLEFYEQNRAKDYVYHFDASKPIEEVAMLDETKAIIVILFRDFFASEKQKEKLEYLLTAKENAYQEKIKEQYKPEDLFRKKKPINPKEEEERISNTSLVVAKKKNVINRILEKIKNFLQMGRA